MFAICRELALSTRAKWDARKSTSLAARDEQSLQKLLHPRATNVAFLIPQPQAMFLKSFPLLPLSLNPIIMNRLNFPVLTPPVQHAALHLEHPNFAKESGSIRKLRKRQALHLHPAIPHTRGDGVAPAMLGVRHLAPVADGLAHDAIRDDLVINAGIRLEAGVRQHGGKHAGDVVGGSGEIEAGVEADDAMGVPGDVVLHEDDGFGGLRGAEIG